MIKVNKSLQFIIDMSKVQAVVSRRFDGGLLGLGLSEFMILLQLSQAEGETMRRVDLAEKVGLTPSGVTRLLLPMAKIGLVKKQTNSQDARVSLVTLAPSGKRMLQESVERAGFMADDLLKPVPGKRLTEAAAGMQQLAETVK